MKILWVKAGGLVPPDTGGKIRSYNILRELAREHSVTILTFYAAHPGDIHQELQVDFERVINFPLRVPHGRGVIEAVRFMTHLLDPRPYTVSKYSAPQVSRSLRDLIKNHLFDVIVCDFVAAGGVMHWESNTPIVLFTHNVETLIWKRHYKTSANPLWKAITWIEYRKMESFERFCLKGSAQVLAVSPTDRESLAAMVTEAKISTISTGVDTEYFEPTDAVENACSMVFVGSMDWMPNEDGILNFFDEVWPRIKQEVPEASLVVVGRNPSRRVQELSREPGVTVTGRVEDVRPYVSEASVCIVPLRIGSGTRLKIFEAMAMAKAVVSTTVGAEGLPITTGHNIVIADAPQQFAREVVELFRSPDKRKLMGRAARDLVESSFSWKSIAKQFSGVLEDVVARSR